MSEDFEEHIMMCKANIAQIYTMLQVCPENWESYFVCARSAITSIDAIPFMADPMRIDEQLWIIEGLQNMAFQEPGNGSLSDIAHWCMRQWLVALEHHPHHIRVLRGGSCLLEHPHHLLIEGLHKSLTLERTCASMDAESPAISRQNSRGRGQQYHLLL